MQFCGVHTWYFHLEKFAWSINSNALCIPVSHRSYDMELCGYKKHLVDQEFHSSITATDTDRREDASVVFVK